ncbi:hypothetical protein J5491_03515 [Candidatus Saccharibacteria bacterium]|nr:hypothetical protein [Candidatus Saccharibacteria bacterium]
MSLYGNFTVKEWLTLHCTTDDVYDLFRKALKRNDEPMAVLALAELIKRGDIDLVTYAIQEATDAGYIALGSHFSTVFANALMQCGNRDPILRRVGKNVCKKGFWPKTATELLEGTDFVDIERPAPQQIARTLDR